MSDPTTQSNYDEIATEHVDFDWKLDFNTRIIQGTATHYLIAKGENVNEVMFVSFPIAMRRPSIQQILDLIRKT